MSKKTTPNQMYQVITVEKFRSAVPKPRKPVKMTSQKISWFGKIRRN